MPTAPTDAATQLQWLVDRALISDLLVEFARTLDERDWAANTALYTPDGVFTAGPGFTLRGHAELRRTGTPQGLGRYRGTWHLSANHAIQLDGDTARTRSYLLGVHLLDEDTFRHADGAGWYDCALRRTDEGWRFTSVSVHEVWHAGEPLPHVPRPAEIPARRLEVTGQRRPTVDGPPDQSSSPQSSTADWMVSPNPVPVDSVQDNRPAGRAPVRRQ